MSVYHSFCRAYQLVFALGVRVLPWRVPQLYEGAGSFSRLPELLRRCGSKRPLVVASRRQSGQTQFRAALQGLDCVFYTGVASDPTVAVVEELAALYRREHCDNFVAVGGGSPMDAAKIAAARVARPARSVAQLKGLLKVRRALPPLIAVPTTAGTGSETTIAAVVTDENRHKYSVSDLCLVPYAAVLDPLLSVSLPAGITAQTGLDALTHAVEAYTNRFYNTAATRRMAAEAVADIFRYLPRAVENGGDIEARQKLLMASYKAGAAFTRSCVGNVHALAHTLGGCYHVPHGLANAVLLPLVLEDYGAAAQRPLDALARAAGIEGGAAGFVAAIRAMNTRFGIPTGFSCIRSEDIPQMAAWAEAEANPLYPCPKLYGRAGFARLLRAAMTEQ